MRRVAGYHDIRMDGMVDLVMRAKGASVLDIGCNRGLVGFEFANNGASLVHGLDIDEDCIEVARGVFIDLRAVQARFEVVDLTRGEMAVTNVFGDMRYDIVLCLATVHKLKRIMAEADLEKLVVHFGRRTKKWFAWRATSNDRADNDRELELMDRHLGAAGLKRIHTSRLSETLDIAAIWGRD
jgi:SAM-dependent methyltransferase